MYINHRVIELALPPLVTNLPNISSSSTSSIPSSTAMLTPSLVNHIAAPTKQASNQDSHPIQPWIIAAVVLACLAVLGACVSLAWVMHQSRKRKLVYGEKGHVGKQ